MIFKPGVVAALVAFLSVASCHPGEKHDPVEELKQAKIRHYIADVTKRGVDQCSGVHDVQARKQRAMKRRLDTFNRLRQERGLGDHAVVHRRDNTAFSKWAAVNHDSTLKYNASTPEATVFSTNGTTCVLTPDNADGPYFVQGEQFRSNVVESQTGVPLHLEMQFLDVSTCRPAEGLFVDVWSANSTGVYSGISTSGEGGLGTTYLRGVQASDSDGVVIFDTLFPGHYSGRANHEHVVVHVGATKLANGTYSGGHVAHLSQLFFDQSLVNSVEALSPYSKNTIARTSNAADGFTGYGATNNYDPFPEYIQLGSSLSDGLFMWIEMALNTSANYDSYVPPAAWQGANGGIANSQFANGNVPLVVVEPPPTHG